MGDLNQDLVIEVKDLTFTYSGSDNQALKALNLAVHKGEFIGITGPTGAGKTTLSYCLNGIIPHFIEGSYTGDVQIKGHSVFDLSSQEISRWIGSVFQDPEAQLVSANVEEELAFGPENIAIAPEEIQKRIDFALKSVGIETLRTASIDSLSGGQKQRVAIAAVLTMLPEIIILDEPTAELDPMGTDDVFSVLHKLNEEHGITIIIIEHKLEHLSKYCQRLIVMDEGQIVVDGAPAQIFAEWQKIQSVGVKPPQVTEFFGKLPGYDRQQRKIPVTLEEAEQVLNDLLSKDEDVELR